MYASPHCRDLRRCWDRPGSMRPGDDGRQASYLERRCSMHRRGHAPSILQRMLASGSLRQRLQSRSIVSSSSWPPIKEPVRSVSPSGAISERLPSIPSTSASPSSIPRPHNERRTRTWSWDITKLLGPIHVDVLVGTSCSTSSAHAVGWIRVAGPTLARRWPWARRHHRRDLPASSTAASSPISDGTLTLHYPICFGAPTTSKMTTAQRCSPGDRSA